MNKLVFSTLLIGVFFGSCSKDDDCHCVNTNDLISPELAEMRVSTGTSTTSFTGVLMVYPCTGDSSLYYGITATIYLNRCDQSSRGWGV